MVEVHNRTVSTCHVDLHLLSAPGCFDGPELSFLNTIGAFNRCPQRLPGARRFECPGAMMAVSHAIVQHSTPVSLHVTPTEAEFRLWRTDTLVRLAANDARYD